MQLIKNSAYLFISRVLNSIAILTLVLIISRKLGPELFGGYSFLNAVIMTGIVLANFGLDTLMVKEVSIDNNSGDKFLGSVIGFKVISSLVVMTGLYGLFNLFSVNQVLIKLLGIFSLVICLNSISQSFWYYGDAFLKFRFHAGLWAFSNIIKVPIVWFFLLLSSKEDLDVVVYALVVAELFSLLISSYVIRLNFKFCFSDISFKYISSLFKKVWPIAIIFILSAVYFRVDLIILELIKGEKSVGIYSAAFKIIEFLSIIPGTVCIAALPELSKGYSKNINGFKEDIFKTFLMLATGGLICGLILYTFSEQIIKLLYGPQYNESVNCLVILSWVVFFFFVNGYFAFVMIATNNDRSVAVILVISTILNVLMNLYLIPRYSYIGAAFSALFSGIFMLIMYVIIFIKTNMLPDRTMAVSDKID